MHVACWLNTRALQPDLTVCATCQCGSKGRSSGAPSLGGWVVEQSNFECRQNACHHWIGPHADWPHLLACGVMTCLHLPCPATWHAPLLSGGTPLLHWLLLLLQQTECILHPAATSPLPNQKGSLHLPTATATATVPTQLILMPHRVQASCSERLAIMSPP